MVTQSKYFSPGINGINWLKIGTNAAGLQLCFLVGPHPRVVSQLSVRVYGDNDR